MTTANEPETSWWPSVVPVWLVTAIGVLLVHWWMPNAPLTGVAGVAVGGVLLSFVAQLMNRRSVGFVHRTRLSMSGVAALAVIGAVIGLLAR